MILTKTTLECKCPGDVGGALTVSPMTINQLSCLWLSVEFSPEGAMVKDGRDGGE